MKRNHPKRPPRTVPGTSEDILAYLAAHGTHDKDTFSPLNTRVPGPSLPSSIEKKKGGTKRMTLDLHRMKSDEAARRIRSAVDFCRHHGIDELKVIHGQGYHSPKDEGPVLKKLVLDMLELDLRLQVRKFRPGLPREGGGGVTVVTIT